MIEEKDNVMFRYSIDKSCFLFIESCATISIADLRIVMEVGGPRRETGKREEAKLKDPNSQLGSCRSDSRATTRQSVEAALFRFRLQNVILDRYDTIHRHLDFFFPLHLT